MWRGLLQGQGVALPGNFLNQVSLDFGVPHADQHYHVPLLVSLELFDLPGLRGMPKALLI